MSKTTGVWGIDVGQCALKALRLEMIEGQVTATAYDYIEHAKLLSQPDADPDSLTREALEKFLSRNPIGKDQIAVSIAGQSGLVRFVKLPPVEEKKVADIVSFEAKQQIPFPLTEVVWDFQKIGGGDNVGGFAMETEIGLFAMKRDIINRHLGHYQSVKAEVHYVQMTPLALCNYATYELLNHPDSEAEANDDTPKGKKRCAVILDIGTDGSNLIITDGGKIIWQRPVPLGGNNFTRALTKELKLTFAKAEHLKRNAAKSPELASILKALRPVLTDFVGEVQRSLGYFTNTHRDAHVAYMVGLGSAFKLPGLQKYMSEKLSLTVRKPSSMTRLQGETVLNDPLFLENILTFPVSYGLALQGLGEARLKTNLLPNEIRVDRIVRAKKPWAAAAAAALLLGVGGVAMGFASQYSSVSDESVTKALAQGQSVVEAAKKQEGERASKDGDVQKTLGDVKAIITGNEERLNWVRLLEVVSAALPRHGYYETDKTTGQIREITNTNLNLDSQVPFWNTPEGIRAYQKYTSRLASGVPLERLYQDDLSEHLAQVQIEAIDARYTDNLQGFIDNAARYADDKYGLKITDDLRTAYQVNGVDVPAEKDIDEATKKQTPKAPEGGAWVVELRGYTYYKDSINFLRRGMVRNLQRFDQFAEATDRNGNKVSNLLPGVADPAKGKVSHAFLCVAHDGNKSKSSQLVQFQVISNSFLDSFVTSAAAGGGFGPSDGMGEEGMGDTGAGPGRAGPAGPGILGAPGGPGGPGGATGAASASGRWFNLLTGASTGSAGGGFQGGPGGVPGGPALPGGPGVPGGPGIAGGGGTYGDEGGESGFSGGFGPLAQGSTDGGELTSKKPTEFVIYFFWREPATSDPAALAVPSE